MFLYGVSIIEGLMEHIPVHIVDFEENRQISALRDDTGKAVELRPVDGSERAFLDLRLPGGEVVRAEIPHDEFEQHVASLL
jgi:hypothetical protein